MENNEVEELEFDEAIQYASKKKTALVWVGFEPKEYIEELLGVEKNTIKQISINQVLKINAEQAKELENHIFVCYHGNSSRYVVDILKDKYGIHALNLKGGITRIVGEIF